MLQWAYRNIKSTETPNLQSPNRELTVAMEMFYICIDSNVVTTN